MFPCFWLLSILCDKAYICSIYIYGQAYALWAYSFTLITYNFKARLTLIFYNSMFLVVFVISGVHFNMDYITGDYCSTKFYLETPITSLRNWGDGRNRPLASPLLERQERICQGIEQKRETNLIIPRRTITSHTYTHTIHSNYRFVALIFSEIWHLALKNKGKSDIYNNSHYDEQILMQFINF